MNDILILGVSTQTQGLMLGDGCDAPHFSDGNGIFKNVTDSLTELYSGSSEQFFCKGQASALACENCRLSAVSILSSPDAKRLEGTGLRQLRLLQQNTIIK